MVGLWKMLLIACSSISRVDMLCWLLNDICARWQFKRSLAVSRAMSLINHIGKKRSDVLWLYKAPALENRPKRNRSHTYHFEKRMRRMWIFLIACELDLGKLQFINFYWVTNATLFNETPIMLGQPKRVYEMEVSNLEWVNWGWRLGVGDLLMCFGGRQINRYIRLVRRKVENIYTLVIIWLEIHRFKICINYYGKVVCVLFLMKLRGEQVYVVYDVCQLSGIYSYHKVDFIIIIQL